MTFTFHAREVVVAIVLTVPDLRKVNRMLEHVSPRKRADDLEIDEELLDRTPDVEVQYLQTATNTERVSTNTVS